MPVFNNDVSLIVLLDQYTVYLQYNYIIYIIIFTNIVQYLQLGHLSWMSDNDDVQQVHSSPF